MRRVHQKLSQEMSEPSTQQVSCLVVKVVVCWYVVCVYINHVFFTMHTCTLSLVFQLQMQTTSKTLEVSLLQTQGMWYMYL